MAGQLRNLTLGTAGALQHGKTSLVRRLTGWETDRLREERQRGMSLESGYAPCQLGDQRFAIVDVPGHEECFSARLAGTTGVDGILLVIAADTVVPVVLKEQLQLLDLLGIRHGVVALTKIDRLLPDERPAAAAQLRQLLQTTLLEEATIVPVSSVTGEGLRYLQAALEHLLQQLPGRGVEEVFRLPLDRAFAGTEGTAWVEGVAVAGEVRIGDDIILLPHGQVGRVRRLEVQGQSHPAAQAGHWTVVEVASWDPHTIRRGDVLTQPGYFAPQRWVLGQLRVLAPERRSWKSGTAVTLHTGTMAMAAVLHPLEGAVLQGPGEHLVQLHTAEPIVAAAGDPFVLRTTTPQQILGGGLLLGTVSRRYPRNSPALLAELHRQAATLSEQREASCRP